MDKPTIIIAGATRGIGAIIAHLLAILGWNVVILGKTAEPHKNLSGTIYTVANAINVMFPDQPPPALPLQVDVRDKKKVEAAIKIAVETFGGIDALVCNASAIILDPTPRQIQLMNDVIVGGTRNCVEACLPYLQKSPSPHVVSIAPPYPLSNYWLKKYGAYAEAKNEVGRYMQIQKIRYPEIMWNTVWPRKMVCTAATIHLFGEEKARACTRSPEIMADAITLLLQMNESENNGRGFLDETVLQEFAHYTSFSRYLLPQSKEDDLTDDIFI